LRPSFPFKHKLIVLFAACSYFLRCVLSSFPPGTKKRPITLRRSLLAQTSRSALEEIKLKVGGVDDVVPWVTAMMVSR
jgi:hypothetical protein